eukprot:jgi/Botrbrau1/2919/Bobra.0036s0052.1
MISIDPSNSYIVTPSFQEEMSGPWGQYPMDNNFPDMTRTGQGGQPYLTTHTIQGYDYLNLNTVAAMQQMGLDATIAPNQIAFQQLNARNNQLYGANPQVHLGPRGHLGDRGMMDQRYNPPPGPRGYYTQHNPGYGGMRDGGHGSGGRRQAVEINVNKAITKRLASAVHYQRVLDVVAESVESFDEVNVATALHRLAKLQPPNSSGNQSPIVFTPQFRELVFAIKRLLKRFESQAVSNTMWAFATLSFYPDNDLLDQLAHHAASIISTFRPQATSNTLWAFAKLGYTPCEPLLRAAAAQMTLDLTKSVPQDISNGLWAYATLRQYPGAGLLDAAARQATNVIRQFKPQEIANTLWSYATLNHDPGNALLDAMAIQMVERIQQFRPQAISNSLWAYAKLGYNPGKELLAVTSRRAQTMLHQYTSQEVANTLWAVATLDHNPGAALLDAAAVQILRRIEQFSPQDVSNSIWSLAKLYHHPSSELLQAGALYMHRHWGRFKPTELANMMWALATLRGCTPETWTVLLEKLSEEQIQNFEKGDLITLYTTFMLLQGASNQMGGPPPPYSLPELLLDAAVAAFQETNSGNNAPAGQSAIPKEVSDALWAMNIQHEVGVPTADGMFTVDILIPDNNVIIEVDGPSQYSGNVQRPLGPVLARRSILESKGYVVRTVPYSDWKVLENIEQQKGYLRRLVGASAQTTSSPG